MAEDTPLSYRLHFQTSQQELTTPNLFAPFTEYHADLSAVGSALVMPLKDLVLTYQCTSSTALCISPSPPMTAPQAFWSTCAGHPSITAAPWSEYDVSCEVPTV